MLNKRFLCSERNFYGFLANRGWFTCQGDRPGGPQPRTKILFPRTAYHLELVIAVIPGRFAQRIPNQMLIMAFLRILAERSFTDNSISIIKPRFHAMWISIEMVCILWSCTDRRRSCKDLSTISRLFPRRFRLCPQIFHKKGLKRDSRECFLIFFLPLLRFFSGFAFFKSLLQWATLYIK